MQLAKQLPHYHILMSFGATDTIFNFLEQHQVLNLQQLNRWMYEKGVSRAQRRWRSAWKVGISILSVPRPQPTLYRYDGLLHDAQYLRKLDDFNFG
mmetsp:Transcript_22881/g.28438  ORF Transcript_22881/g.28438 Transcript_22881/m.28438 type:complete len:96 (+) Transcript_22881:32-319(+)